MWEKTWNGKLKKKKQTTRKWYSNLNDFKRKRSFWHNSNVDFNWLFANGPENALFQPHYFRLLVDNESQSHAVKPRREKFKWIHWNFMFTHAPKRVTNAEWHFFFLVFKASFVWYFYEVRIILFFFCGFRGISWMILCESKNGPSGLHTIIVHRSKCWKYKWNEKKEFLNRCETER